MSVQTQTDLELSSMGLEVTKTLPPDWRTPWLKPQQQQIPLSRDLQHVQGKVGFPGFYPTWPGHQDEDTLTETAVHRGYTTPPAVTAEGFSAHKMIHAKLQNPLGILPALSNLVADVRKAQQSHQTDVPPHTFKLPPRVTWNDQRRENYLNELKLPETPINKLGKQIPHGFRGEKLLDMLTTRQMPLSRAVWFVRAIGASEIHSQKARSMASEVTYTAEWTGFVCDFIKKQINEITLPSAPTTSRPGFNIKTKAKPTLSEPEFRQNWTTRFSYTSALTLNLFQERLLDRPKMLDWLLDQMRTVHLGQLPFILHLSLRLLHHFTSSFRLSIHLVEVLLVRLQECKSETVPAPPLEASLQATLCHIFSANPRSFVAPKLWIQHRPLMQDTLQNSADLDKSLIADITQRVDNMLIVSESHDGSSNQTKQAAHIISIYDEIGFPTDMADGLERLRAASGSIVLKLRLALTWSTTYERRGSYRRHAAAYLWKAMDATGNLSKLDGTQICIDWVDSLSASSPVVSHQDVLRMFALLQSGGLFDYTQYFQHMTGRGSFKLSSSNQTEELRSPSVSTALHQLLLRSLPLPSTAPPSLSTQRRVLLQLPPETAHESSQRLSHLRRTMIRALPCLSTSDQPADPEATASARKDALRLLKELPTCEETEKFVCMWLHRTIISLDGSRLTAPEVSFLALALKAADKPELALHLCLTTLSSSRDAEVIHSGAQVLVLLREYMASTAQIPRAQQALVAVSKRFQSQSLYLSCLAYARKSFTPASCTTVQERPSIEPAEEDSNNNSFDLLALDTSASQDTVVQLATVAAYKIKSHPNVALSLWNVLTQKLRVAEQADKQLDICFRYIWELDLRLEQNFDDALCQIIEPWLVGINYRPSREETSFIFAMFLGGICSFSTLLDKLITPLLKASLKSDQVDVLPALDLVSSIFTVNTEHQCPIVSTEHCSLEQQTHLCMAARRAFCFSKDGMEILRRFAAGLCQLETHLDAPVAEHLASCRRRIFTCKTAQISFQRYPHDWASVCLGLDDDLSRDAQLLVLDTLTSICCAFGTANECGEHRPLRPEAPGPLAVWRLDSTRITMQAYLARSERLEDEKQTVQELENFLDHVVFEGDALLAEDLMKYLTTSGTDQFVQLALRRINNTLQNHTSLFHGVEGEQASPLMKLVARLKILMPQIVLTQSQSASVELQAVNSLRSLWLSAYDTCRTSGEETDMRLPILAALHSLLFFFLQILSLSDDKAAYGQAELPVISSLLATHSDLLQRGFPPTALLRDIQDALSWLWQDMTLEAKSTVLSYSEGHLLRKVVGDIAAPSSTIAVDVDGTPCLRPHAEPSPWDLLEVPGPPTWDSNIGPISLQHLKIRGLECPAATKGLPPLDKPAKAKEGDRHRFPTECTSLRDTIWARDSRLGLGQPQPAAVRPLPSQKAPGAGTASPNATKKANDGSNSTSTPGEKRPEARRKDSSSNNASAKRKERAGSPEVEIVAQPSKRPKPTPRPRVKKAQAAQ